MAGMAGMAGMAAALLPRLMIRARLAVSFGPAAFARDLTLKVLDAPLSFTQEAGCGPPRPRVGVARL